MKELEFLIRAGKTRRFHTVPLIHDNSVAEHSWGVVMLTLLMTDYLAPQHVLIYAAAHDAAEFVTGDIPSPAKREFGIGEHVSELEQVVLSNHGFELPDIEPEWLRVVKLADCFDGMLKCVQERRLGNRFVKEAFLNWCGYVRAMDLHEGIEKKLYTGILDMWDAEECR